MHLMYLWLKIQGSPLLFSLSVSQLSCPEAEVTTVGEGQLWCPRVVSEMERGEKNVPVRSSVWCGVSGHSRAEGGTPRGAEVLHGVLESKRGEEVVRMRERVVAEVREWLHTGAPHRISTFIKDHGSQVSHCQKREVQIQREN